MQHNKLNFLKVRNRPSPCQSVLSNGVLIGFVICCLISQITLQAAVCSDREPLLQQHRSHSHLSKVQLLAGLDVQPLGPGEAALIQYYRNEEVDMNMHEIRRILIPTSQCDKDFFIGWAGSQFGLLREDLARGLYVDYRREYDRRKAEAEALAKAATKEVAVVLPPVTADSAALESLVEKALEETASASPTTESATSGASSKRLSDASQGEVMTDESAVTSAGSGSQVSVTSGLRQRKAIALASRE